MGSVLGWYIMRMVIQPEVVRRNPGIQGRIYGESKRILQNHGFLEGKWMYLQDESFLNHLGARFSTEP